eukprot:COSAG04_NODE_155_length_22379_cov_5.613707_16_plen_208_part_00
MLVGVSCGIAFRSEGLGAGSVTAFLANHARSRGVSGWLLRCYDGLNLLVALVVYLTFPLQLLPAAEVLSSRWCGSRTAPTERAAEDAEETQPLTQATASEGAAEGARPAAPRSGSARQRLCLVLGCNAVTLVVPQVGLLVALFGSVGWTVLAAAPALCRLALLRRAGGLRCSARVALDLSVVGFCACVMVVGTALAIQDIVRAWGAR